MNITHIASYENNCWVNENVCAGANSTGHITNSADILTLTGEERQSILGFGGCFNELGWEALNLAKPEQKEAFLQELFEEKNCNFNYGRIPVGANDFSIKWYSCDEEEDDYALEHFNIERDK
ncbi:MAG: glycosyl hydrolase, partial [Lachnospiraceae bacterium]|nr:glycosyl hydrolase [Lachnospiraceae bacterium]